MRRVLLFGTFDGVHAGHRNLLKQASLHGDNIIVVVARDETVRQVKGRLPKQSEDERVNALRALQEVDEAYLGLLEDKYDIIIQLQPDVICLGYDQSFFTDNLSEELRKRGINPLIIRLKPYMEEKFKSSLLSEPSN